MNSENIKIISSKIDRETKEGKIVIEVEEVPQEVKTKIAEYVQASKVSFDFNQLCKIGEYGYQLAKEIPGTLKVFEIHSEGEKDWVAHDEDMFKALKYYLDTTECSFMDIEDVIEVPKDKWDSMFVINTEEHEEANKETFTEVVKRLNGSPGIIASTAY